MTSSCELATPLQLALDGLVTALDHLIKLVDDGALTDLDSPALIEFAQTHESVRNRMPVIDHAIVQAGDAAELPQRLCQRTMTRVLTEALRIAPAEATRRIRAAEHLSDRVSLTGEIMEPWRPQLAAAQRRGEVSPEQVWVIDSALRTVDGRGFHPADVETGEQILCDAALSLKPAELRTVARTVVDAIDPDGTIPNDQLQWDRRDVRWQRSADGGFRGEFRLTAEAGHKLKTVLDSLAAPRSTTFHLADDSGAGGIDDGERVVQSDPRTRGQRLHDALEQVCDRILRSGTLPDTGGIPTTVVITIDADDLASRTGIGQFSDASPVAPGTVIALADEAGLTWCVKGSTGAVLAAGRARRLATPAQTLALAARDAGCSFPGCDIPPEWCERHHVVPWVDGGRTDLDNLTLVCRYHHHNFESGGWRCRIPPGGLPEWIPPSWIDRERRPIVHPRIKINNWRTDRPLPWR